MSMATLFGKLREHELELGRLKEEEEGEKRQSIALNVVAEIESRRKPTKIKKQQIRRMKILIMRH